MPGLYRIVVAKNGQSIASLTRAGKLEYSYQKNDIGTFTFEHPLVRGDGVSDPIIDYIQPLNEILIYRTFLAGERLVWGGYIVNPKKKSSDKSKIVTVQCKEFGWILKKRFAGIGSDRIYTNTQEAVIAWDLINQTQTDTTLEGTVPFGTYSLDDVDLGFRQGTLEPIKLRDRTYKKDEILKLLKQLSEVQDSGEFEITPTLTKPSYKVFSWYQERGGINDKILFSSGNSRIDEVELDISAEEMGNYVLTSGEGNDRINYNPDLKGYPVLQVIDPKKDVSTNQTLDDYGLQLLSEASVPKEEYTFKLNMRIDASKGIEDLGMFDVGDSVRIVYQKDTINVDAYYRVQEIKVKVGDDNKEDVEVKLSNTKKKSMSGFDILKQDRQRLSSLEK